MKFEVISKDEYSVFAHQHPLRHYLQTVEMEEISSLRKWPSYYVGLKENGKLVAASRLVAIKNRIGKNYFYAPRGPLLDYNNFEVLKVFTENLKKFIKSKKGYQLHIDPLVIHKERDIDGNIVEGGIDNTSVIENLKKLGYIHNGFNTEYDYSRQVRWVFCLDLDSKSEEQVFNDMKSTHKTRIRKTERLGIEVKELTYNQLEDYKRITEKTSERRHFHDKTLNYYQTMYNLFGDKIKFIMSYMNVDTYILNIKKELENLSVRYDDNPNKESVKAKKIKVEIEGLTKELDEANILLKDGNYIPLSAAMFILYEGEIYYMYSGSDDKYMKYYGQYAIQWYIIKFGIKNSYNRYNFLGITGNFDKNDSEYGVYEFKKGFNGYVEEYIGDFDLPITYFYKLRKFIK